ncbi:terminase large subunit domain-containing protein [Burkholderia gladioli]|uniref:terminase large subunit domain-containing protein n=1 Tax=Burkholderia gladioli TaxID=28095 RepID=UPI00163E3FC3|nr:terminase family protein [Burkholderia gladioli]
MSDIRFTAADVLAARRELARRNLTDFACMVDIPTVPLTNADDEDRFTMMRLGTLAAHHGLICRKLQQVEEGTIPNLMVLMPPGSAKSTYVDVVFVPWFMARRPRRGVILASYASDIAAKQGRRARQLIKSPSFERLMNLGLSAESAAADQWALSNGSEYMAGGLLSGLTGNRAHLGIVDDPIKGREQAESDTIRKKTWDAYVDDFCSRLIPGAPQIMMLTRWHQDDPAGRILPEGWDGQSGVFDGRDGRVWHVVCLPALADRADDPLGRKLGETLWPEWFSLEHWKPFQRNRRTWFSLYQQKPTPDEGTYFQKAWFRRYRPGSQPARLNYYLTSDHAPAGSADSDFQCVRVWGVDAQSNVYLIDGFRRQITMDKLVAEVVGNTKAAEMRAIEPQDRRTGLIAKYKPFAWFPEDDNNWKAIAGFVTAAMRLEKKFVRIEPISPHGANKEVKAQAFQGMASSGAVFLPEGPEGDDVLDQYVKFPTAKNDDEVDAASLIGRALADAHPAVVPVAESRPVERDRWDRAFNRDDAPAEGSWRVA